MILSFKVDELNHLNVFLTVNLLVILENAPEHLEPQLENDIAKVSSLGLTTHRDMRCDSSVLVV